MTGPTTGNHGTTPIGALQEIMIEIATTITADEEDEHTETDPEIA